MVYAKLLIDNQMVATSRKVPLKWPSFEADLMDQFQIYVFTLPHQVEMEIYFGDTMIDKFDIEIPGQHVKSLTSASRLIKEYPFKNNF